MAGRCAGCGETSQSCKKIKSHVMVCPKYLELFKASPERCLPPEEEFERWKAEEDNPEARAAAKDERLSKRFAEMDRRRDEQVARWQPKDILAD